MLLHANLRIWAAPSDGRELFFFFTADQREEFSGLTMRKAKYFHPIGKGSKS